MKTVTSLIVLSLGAGAFAQNPDVFRRDRDQERGVGRGLRVEGRYESRQWEDALRRTLVLERDGRAEIATEVRGRRGRGNDSGDWKRDLRDTYGTIADEAARRGRPVRQTGRWSLRDGRVVVRLEEVPDVRGRTRIDLEFVRRDGQLVSERNNDVYGDRNLYFKPDGGWGGSGDDRGPGRNDYGTFLLNGERLRIDDLDLDYDEGRQGTLTVRGAGGRRVEMRGETRRRGDQVTLRLGPNDSERGEFQITMRGDRPVSVRGSGHVGRQRLEF